MKRLLTRSVSVIFIVCLMLPFAAEIGLRVMYSEVDYLRPSFVADSALGYKIASYSSGHDKLGFRNADVSNTDLVAIGDSQTYSIATSRNESWPMVLSAELSTPVYNMAVGGYGASQYAELAKIAIEELRAKTIVLGVFLGDDAQSYANTQFVPHEMTVKTWFEAHSMLFNWVFYHWPGDAVRYVKKAIDRDNSVGSILSLERDNVSTDILVSARNKSMDLRLSSVRKGVDNLVKHIERIDKQVKLFVVLIPTKALVLEKYTPVNNAPKTLVREWQSSIALENALRLYLKQRLLKLGIQVVDPSKALQKVAAEKSVYFSDYNGHFTAAGQQAIAQAVARRMIK